MKKLNKANKRPLAYGVLIGLASNIIIYIIVNSLNYVYNLEPHIVKLSEDINTLCKKEAEAESILRKLEGNYLFKDNSGQVCTIGVNPNLKDGYASAYTNNMLKIKNGERISIIRNDGTHAPSVVTVTVFIIDKPQNAPNSEADFFIDKASVEMLGYVYADVKKKGLLRNLTFKRYPNDIGK